MQEGHVVALVQEPSLYNELFFRRTFRYKLGSSLDVRETEKKKKKTQKEKWDSNQADLHSSAEKEMVLDGPQCKEPRSTTPTVASSSSWPNSSHAEYCIYQYMLYTVFRI